MQVVPYGPVVCKACGSALNPYCETDFNGKLWICPFCHSRNHFPAHYTGVSETNMPAELFPQFTTIEYTLSDMPPAMAPAYLFVIDTALTEDELAACRAALTRMLQNVQEYAQVHGRPLHLPTLRLVTSGNSKYRIDGSSGLVASVGSVPI